MTYDSWKTTEPDREPAPGEHRPYDDTCDCDECRSDGQADGDFEKGYDQAVHEIERHFAKTQPGIANEIRREWSIVWRKR